MPLARWGVILVATAAALIAPAGGASATESGKTDQAYDFRLVNQDGQAVRLSEFRGKTVLVSYIFTRCPMPSMCPLVTSKMKQVQAAVNKGLKDRVVLVSISFDPAYDTPEVLKEYGERYGADFSNWQFLTGDVAEIQAAAQDANVIYEDMGEGNFTHNMNTVLIAPDGTVRQRFRGSGWKVRDVVEAIQQVAGRR
ncbi:MAG: SCO family protein [Candidatus Omnitrophota bacterium]|nr:SCO family protein [Candidatus Omnitrophota bacterium]